MRELVEFCGGRVDPVIGPRADVAKDTNWLSQQRGPSTERG